MANQWIKYVLHIIAWGFLYILPYLFSFEGLSNYATIFSQPGDYIHLASFSLLIGFFYLNYLVLFPKLYFYKKYILYILSVSVCFWIVVYLPIQILPDHFFRPVLPDVFFQHGRRGPHPPREPFLFGRNYTILLFILSSFVAISIRTNQHLQKIENEKLNAELLFLKAQINPHFLFNTLNSIYSLAIQKDDKTPEAIVQLSDLMRYILRDTKENLVSLDKEVEYINNYIALQQARMGNTVKVTYTKEGAFYNKKIAPLFLISFIENAFKHGLNPDENSEITIEIKLAEDKLHLYVKNKQVTSVNQEAGIGLQNTQERLKLLYPSAHSLNIKEEEGNYIVQLSISL